MSIRDERKQQSRQALLDAALALNTSGRSFSSISLREIARHVGLVPTAFYRHFQDMNELGLELVDQVALHLKGIFHQLGQAYIYQPDTETQISLDLFFQAVEHHPEPWVFMIAERWGGSEVIRQAIAREINFLIEDLANDLGQIEAMQHIGNTQDLQVFSNILINLSFTWAMTWMDINRHYQAEERLEQQKQFKLQTMTQVHLIFRGISNWDPSKDSVSS
ncbi:MULTISPECIES: TetR family transcriptional regulator [unclassified Acinetobacter]|jgi:AcrR family transcriptional regulator|uniref:TetR family transcriptional regulator n=1 Tax=unclassified Acinetobacter TaxID=196816 RepID=UPI000A32EFE1|nr:MULTISPECIES: TetR family transcriptional regulator [unclassified Acinetobacter]MDD2946618.1 TetR family transcriptional regulator [Acinetobacter sp.]OTG71515.1 TetR family transcriptional regulator [Acinetobacter sp. ANC 4218]QQN39364.1 TetR family transcriptional regulator [Acinetobacter sp. CS-2]